MNNKNNTANTAEENNNKKIIYGVGIVGIAILCLSAYAFWPPSDEKGGNSSSINLLQTANNLIKRDFLSKKCSEGIKKYQDSDKTDKDQKELKGLLKQKKAKVIEKTYNEKKEKIDKCKTRIASMLLQEAIYDLEKTLKNVQKDHLDGKEDSNLKEARKLINNALDNLKEAKKAETDDEVKKALGSAGEHLKECTEVGFSYNIFKGRHSYLSDSEKAEKVVNGANGKIKELPYSFIGKDKIQPYSKKNLQNELETWKKYRSANDDHAIAKEVDMLEA